MPVHVLLGNRNLRWPRSAPEISSAPFVDIMYYKKRLLLVILSFTVSYWLVVSSLGLATGCAGTLERRPWRIASSSCVEYLPASHSPESEPRYQIIMQ